jgi:IS5 family transposase
VVAANVSYPTDSGLLVRAIKLIVGLVAAIHAAGGASRTKVTDRRRAAGRRARSISAHLKLRNDEAKAVVLSITGELADLAEATATEAVRVLTNARRWVACHGDAASGRLRSSVAELEVIVERAHTVIGQTRRRLAGDMPASATRLVSMHDPDARPIAKGRLGKPVEFGYKAQVVDNVDGIIVDHSVHQGNPADAPLLAPAVERIKELCGRAPRAVTADRGYGEAKTDQALSDLGVKNVVIPRKGQPSATRRATEHRRGFVRLVKWRTGSEGRISHLKRRFGWDRTLSDSLGGATTWCGLGVLAHNAVKIAVLIDNRQATQATTASPVRDDTATIRTDPVAPDPPPGPPPPAATAA